MKRLDHCILELGRGVEDPELDADTALVLLGDGGVELDLHVLDREAQFTTLARAPGL